MFIVYDTNTPVKKGVPIALINSKNPKLISFDKDMEDTHTLITENDITPFISGDNIYYIFGRRGCGKSYTTNLLIDNFKKFSDGSVYLVSSLREDTSIPTDVMRLDTQQLPSKDELREYNSALFIFDDIEGMENLKHVEAFKKMLVENSRHYNINLIITAHIPNVSIKTRSVLYETNNIVFFPKYSQRENLVKMCKYYYGIDRETIDRLCEYANHIKSRWIVFNTIHHYFISNSSCGSISSLFHKSSKPVLTGGVVSDIKPISDKTIISGLKRYKIKLTSMPYSELATTNELPLPVLILYQLHYPVGHWVILFKNEYGINYYDPTGHAPDELLNVFDNPLGRSALNADFTHLIKLLRDLDEDIIFNEFRHQRDDTNICGHLCFIRLVFSEYSNEEFNEKVIGTIKSKNGNYEENVYDTYMKLINKQL